MNTSVADLLRRVERVLDQYDKQVKGKNKFRSVPGFASALIQIFRKNRNPHYLLQVLKMKHPRPQIRKQWNVFARLVSGEVGNLAGRPALVLRFLGYLKWKAYIRSKERERQKNQKQKPHHDK